MVVATAAAAAAVVGAAWAIYQGHQTNASLAEERELRQKQVEAEAKDRRRELDLLALGLSQQAYEAERAVRALPRVHRGTLTGHEGFWEQTLLVTNVLPGTAWNVDIQLKETHRQHHICMPVAVNQPLVKGMRPVEIVAQMIRVEKPRTVHVVAHWTDETGHYANVVVSDDFVLDP
jgi:hypothetical protein